MHEELRQELTRIFNDGDSAGGTTNKRRKSYTAIKSWKEIQEMKLSNRLLGFSNMSEY